MPQKLYDAHVHLAADGLITDQGDICSSYSEIGLERAVVVGTSPVDWPDVLEICSTDERLIPALGLHPWQVNDAPVNWQEQLLRLLEIGARILGEIGLDQWVENYDIERQTEAFRWQFAIATARNLPTSIHCLRAHEPMLRILRSVDIPARGFKLHAYSGPIDTLKPLLDLGAYFSFNGGQLKPRAKRVRELIKLVPSDRLLIETDAPDFLPAAELQEFHLSEPDLCHPANIRAGYRAIAELRGCSFEELTQTVHLNFRRYFLDESD